MWALCVLKTKSQRDSIKTENSEQSYLSYDELCQSVQQNQEQYTVAKAEHVVRNGAQLVDSALRFGRTVVCHLSSMIHFQAHRTKGAIPQRFLGAPRPSTGSGQSERRCGPSRY